MGKDQLFINGEDVSDDYNFPRHDPDILDREYSYEEIKELIIEYPWLGAALENYLESEELCHREFYAKITEENKYLIRFPIIIDFLIKHEDLRENEAYEEWRYDDSDYEEDDASELTEVDNINERLQLYALRILKPVKITDPSTSEEVEITLENFSSLSFDILRKFSEQYGLLSSSPNNIKKYFEQRDTIIEYLKNDLSDIFPKKSVSELSEQQLKNGIFYIQMKQLESFREVYGEDGTWYNSVRIYYGDGGSKLD
tara:strand:- start:708 stop:1475 length:768 start_codon:yes stop_codon:yes gene_type:complete